MADSNFMRNFQSVFGRQPDDYGKDAEALVGPLRVENAALRDEVEALKASLKASEATAKKWFEAHQALKRQSV